AKFLSAEERDCPDNKTTSGGRATADGRRYSLGVARDNPRAHLGELNDPHIVATSRQTLFLTPQIIESLWNYSNVQVGSLPTMPEICGGIAVVGWGQISDRMNERRWNLFYACVCSTVGVVIAGMTMGT